MVRRTTGYNPYTMMALMGAGGKGKKKEYEAALPIILVAIIVIFALGKIGIIDLTWIPGIGSLFTGAQVRLLVLTDDSTDLGPAFTASVRNSVEAEHRGVVVDKETRTTMWELPKGYAMVVLAREDLTNTMREKIVQYVAGGGKLLILEGGGAQTNETLISGTKAPGWTESGFDALIPVDPLDKMGTGISTSSTGTPTAELVIQANGKILFPYQTPGVGFDVGPATDYVQVTPRAGAETLAYIKDSAGNLYPVIVSKSYTMGKVVYVSFDPTATTGEIVLWRILDYVRG